MNSAGLGYPDLYFSKEGPALLASWELTSKSCQLRQPEASPKVYVDIQIYSWGLET